MEIFVCLLEGNNDDDDNIPTETQNTTALPSQLTLQSEGETHYSSSQSVAASGNDVSDIFATVPSQQILSLAEVRMSEFIEESAPVQNAVLLAENPLETEDGTSTIQSEQQQETIAQPRASSQLEPQQNSTPISSSSNRLNENADLQSQNEFETPSSGSTSTPNIDVKSELSYHLGDDNDVICLGDIPMEIIDLASDDDPSTQELFLQCNDSELCENLITVQTQPSQVVSKENTYQK